MFKIQDKIWKSVLHVHSEELWQGLDPFVENMDMQLLTISVQEQLHGHFLTKLQKQPFTLYKGSWN